MRAWCRTSPVLAAFAALALLTATPLAVSAAGSVSVVDCGQTPSGSVQECAALKVVAVSIYPEQINSVNLSSPYFFVSSDGCTGARLTNTTCPLGIVFSPPAGVPEGPLSATLTVTYTACPYNAQGASVCSTTTSQSSISVKGQIAATSGVAPASSAAALGAPSSGVSALLTGCAASLNAQGYCVFMPL
jgi:hypothetical protein